MKQIKSYLLIIMLAYYFDANNELSGPFSVIKTWPADNANSGQ